MVKKIFFIILFGVLLIGCTDTSYTATKVEENNNNLDIFGEWEISKVLYYGMVGTYSTESAEKLIGKDMTFTIDKASCFGDNWTLINKTINNPNYLINKVTKDEFKEINNIELSNIGISYEDTTEIKVVDSEGNICAQLIENKDKLIVCGGGTYFELIRKDK